MTILEDETSYTDVRGSFVDGQAWLDGEILTQVLAGGTGDRELNFSVDAVDTTAFNAAYVWTSNATTSTAVSSGVLSVVSDSGDGIYTSGWTREYGALYKVKLNITAITGTWVLRQRTGSWLALAEFTTTGPKTVYFIRAAGANEYIYLTAISAGATISIDAGAINNSVEKVTSLSTQFASTGYRLVLDAGDGSLAVGYIGEAGTGLAKTALPNNVTAITKAAAGVVSSVAHDLSIGSQVYFSGLNEMTELNGSYQTVTAVGSVDLFSINDTSGYTTEESTGGACASEVTEPNASAVHIYKQRGLIDEGWYSDALTDYNAGTSFDFDVYGGMSGLMKLVLSRRR